LLDIAGGTPAALVPGMRRSLLALAALLTLGGVAQAESRAEVRPLAGGGEAVYVDGKLAWPTDGRRVKISLAPRWAKSRRAIAVVSQDAKRAVIAVVVLRGPGAGQAIEWNVPASVPAPRVVMWLGPRRVAVGPDELAPSMVVSFELR
jgi:hypothetical protein